MKESETEAKMRPEFIGVEARPCFYCGMPLMSTNQAPIARTASMPAIVAAVAMRGLCEQCFTAFVDAVAFGGWAAAPARQDERWPRWAVIPEDGAAAGETAKETISRLEIARLNDEGKELREKLSKATAELASKERIVATAAAALSMAVQGRPSGPAVPLGQAVDAAMSCIGALRKSAALAGPGPWRTPKAGDTVKVKEVPQWALDILFDKDDRPSAEALAGKECVVKAPSVVCPLNGNWQTDSRYCVALAIGDEKFAWVPLDCVEPAGGAGAEGQLTAAAG